MTALLSAASFDFFLTRPYETFRIARGADVTTTLLLLVVGVIVSGLAARGRRLGEAAGVSRDGLARVHQLAERVVDGEDPDFLVMSVANELRNLLTLRDCRFSRDPPDQKGAWMDPDGVVHLGPIRWGTSSMGLPTANVELAVRGAGRTLGTLLLTPTPAEPVARELCVLAVSLADQLGMALAAKSPDR